MVVAVLGRFQADSTHEGQSDFQLVDLGALTTSNLNLRGTIVSSDSVLNGTNSHGTARVAEDKETRDQRLFLSMLPTFILKRMALFGSSGVSQIAG